MKLLLLQLRRIGDAILTTPALVALREAFPAARITLCVMEPNGGLAPALPGVDEVVVLSRRGGNTRALGRLALGRFDVCLDFTGNDRSAFLALLSKAPRRVTFGGVKKSAWRRLFYTGFVDSSVRERHTIDRFLDLLRPLGVEARAAAPRLEPPAASREAAARALALVGVEGPFAIVHPGTARPEKYWLAGRWAAVIDHCQEALGLPCVLTGGSDPFERQHLEAIAAAARNPVRDLSGRLDLAAYAALVGRAGLLLSMDSAPVHFGAAFGTPQVALFGETNPYHWRPRHEKARILLAGEAGPLETFSPRFKRRPLCELSTEAVIGAITSLLASCPPKPTP